MNVYLSTGCNCVLTVLKKFVGDSRQLSDCLCGVYLLALYMHDLLTENGKGEMN